MALDTMEVRPDERFAVPALAAYLQGRLPGADAPLTVRQFGGGAANLTYLLDFAGREYVLRRPPLGPLAPSSHDMAREYRVLSVLHRAFPAAPQAFLLCEDADIIGAPFFIMERREGIVVRRSMPSDYASFVDAPEQLCAALVDTLVDFHKVDYVSLGLETLGKPQGFLHRQIEGWYGRWHKAKLHDLPAMDAVHAWLIEQCPAHGAVSLVHNDYKLDNAMFASADPGHLVAVFDWDMCTLGDPLADLGTLLCYWAHPDDPPALHAMAMMPLDRRFWTRDQLVQRYAARSGRDVSQIDFYHVLGLYRLAVIAAQIYIRFHRGQTQDARFAAFGDLIPIVAGRAYAITQRVVS